MEIERIEFAVSLSGVFWDKRPQFSIWVDEDLVVSSEINSTAEQVVTFTREITAGEHSLKIRLDNKAFGDTVVEDGNIVKDMLLNIDDITIDDISLGNILWSAEYVLDKPQQLNGKTITHLDNCVNLGWNGTYILKFTSPFYIWLLEKL